MQTFTLMNSSRRFSARKPGGFTWNIMELQNVLNYWHKSWPSAILIVTCLTRYSSLSLLVNIGCPLSKRLVSECSSTCLPLSVCKRTNEACATELSSAHLADEPAQAALVTRSGVSGEHESACLF